jgi:hypothetical protein
MPKTRTTLTIDEDILRSARIAAANRGMKEGEIIEEALTRQLGLGVFERRWARTDAEGAYTEDGVDISTMTDDQLMDWVVGIQHDARAERSAG